LVNDNFGAKAYISEIAEDWRPEGYARVEGMPPEIMATPTFHLDTGGTEQSLTLENYGARVFLFQNRKISDIDNVILCGFSNLEVDLIPDIGGKFDDLTPASSATKK
jgi:hypothetical protein